MAGKGTPGFLPPFKHFATSAIHAGQEPEQWRSGAVVPPISLSTTFKQRAPGEHTVSGARSPHCGLGTPGGPRVSGVAGTGNGRRRVLGRGWSCRCRWCPPWRLLG